MRVTLILVTLLLVAVTAFAAVPQQISYQGRLTSATNTPITGTKNLTFKIYSGAGAVLWNSGTVSVTCADGLFSLNLGASPQPALPSSIFTDTSATLGITVESDPELTPRTRLTSNAFSYVAAKAPDYLPLAGGTLSGNLFWDFPAYDVSLQNFSGASSLQMSGPTSAVVTSLSSSTSGGALTLRDSQWKSSASLQAYSGTGGYLFLGDPTGAPSVEISGDGYGTSILLYTGASPRKASLTASPDFGGSLVLNNSVGDTTIKLINYSGGSGLRMSSRNSSERSVLMADSAQGGYLALFDPAGNLRDLFKPMDGNAYTSLPDSAIGAREIADEPGPAFNFSNGNVILTTTMQDLTTVTITIPTSGYILLSGKVGEIDLAGTTGENWANVQIDETAGGTTNNYYAAAVGGGSYPDIIWHAFTASTQRAYYKTAGTYTFRLEALRGPASNPAGTARAFYPALTAVFYPTSYGTTTAPVAADEAGQFERATAIRPSEPSGTGMTSTNMYEVDLRELELKAAKARAEAEKAERQLIEAKLRQQTSDQANR